MKLVSTRTFSYITWVDLPVRDIWYSHILTYEPQLTIGLSEKFRLFENAMYGNISDVLSTAENLSFVKREGYHDICALLFDCAGSNDVRVSLLEWVLVYGSEAQVERVIYEEPHRVWPMIMKRIVDVGIVESIIFKYESSFGFHGFGLDLCCATGDVDIVRVFVDKSCSLLESDLTRAFVYSCKMGYLDVTKLLIENVTPDVNNNCALHAGCENGKYEIVKFLLSKKEVDPTAGNNYALKVAAEKGYADIVGLLLDHNVNPSVDDNYALRASFANGHTNVMSIILAKR